LKSHPQKEFVLRFSKEKRRDRGKSTGDSAIWVGRKKHSPERGGRAKYLKTHRSGEGGGSIKDQKFHP